MQIKQNHRSIALEWNGMEKQEKCKSPRDLDMTPLNKHEAKALDASTQR